MNGSLQINPKHVINHQKNLYKSFNRDKVKKGQKGQKGHNLKSAGNCPKHVQNQYFIEKMSLNHHFVTFSLSLVKMSLNLERKCMVQTRQES